MPRRNAPQDVQSEIKQLLADIETFKGEGDDPNVLTAEEFRAILDTGINVARRKIGLLIAHGKATPTQKWIVQLDGHQRRVSAYRFTLD